MSDESNLPFSGASFTVSDMAIESAGTFLNIMGRDGKTIEKTVPREVPDTHTSLGSRIEVDGEEYEVEKRVADPDRLDLFLIRKGSAYANDSHFI